MTKSWIASAVAGLLLLISFGALAQDLPPEGQFSITYTAVNPSPIKPLKRDDFRLNRFGIPKSGGF